MKWYFDSSNGEKMFSLEECQRRISERKDFLSRMADEEKEYVLGLENRLKIAQDAFSDFIGKVTNAKVNLAVIETILDDTSNDLLEGKEINNAGMITLLKVSSKIIKKQLDELK